MRIPPRPPEEQLAPVEACSRAPAVEEELECGAEPTALEHNCSGKHAAMLALCRAGAGRARATGCPIIRASTRCSPEVVSAAEVDPEGVPTAADGCGCRRVQASARADGARVSRAWSASTGATAWRARYVRSRTLIRGPTAADTILMRALPGWIAKELACSAPRPPTGWAWR